MPNSPDAYFDATAGGRLAPANPAPFVGPPAPPPQILGRDQTGAQNPNAAALPADGQDAKKKGWAEFFVKLREDPAMQQAMMSIGAQLLQPRDKRQSTLGAVSSAAVGGLETYQKAKDKTESKTIAANKVKADEKFRTDTLAQGQSRIDQQAASAKSLETSRASALSSLNTREMEKRRLEILQDLDKQKADESALVADGAMDIKIFEERWSQDALNTRFNDRLAQVTGEAPPTSDIPVNLPSQPKTPEEAWKTVQEKFPDIGFPGDKDYERAIKDVKKIFPTWKGPTASATLRSKRRGAKVKKETAVKSRQAKVTDRKRWQEIITTTLGTQSDSELRKMLEDMDEIKSRGFVSERSLNSPVADFEKLQGKILDLLGE